MQTSFRNIATLMDPVQSPSSIRALADLHQWLSQPSPPRKLSYRRIVDRHVNPRTQHVRFLWFNTELLPGITIERPRLFELLDELLITLVEPDFQLPQGDIHIEAAKAVKERAKEIGWEIARDHRQVGPYGIAALCEVYQDTSRERIFDALSQQVDRSRISETVGPARAGADVTSSGLYTVCIDKNILRTEAESFTLRGNELTVDLFANKGVLLTEIDVGPGAIDLYSTHLYSGVRIPGFKLGRAQDILEVQRQQVEQIADFIRRTHKSKNVAVLVGDFNMADFDDNFSHDPPKPYKALKRALNRSDLRFNDIWAKRVLRFSEEEHGAGYTWTWNAKSDIVCDLTDIYCDDLAARARLSNPEGRLVHDNYRRIDYIFVQQPEDDHSLRLDITRPRRRSFPRRRASHGKEFLSDHLGLEVTFIASPQ